MSLLLDAIIISVGMIIMFFLVFLVLFMLAVALLPIEKGLSKIIWDYTNPPQKLPTDGKTTFKDFSKKY